MTQFSDFNLPPNLSTQLAAIGYVTPTPVQAAAIPFALEGRDVIAVAMTGSGKTAAFSIPMISRMTASSRGTALIMTPTRELAQQVDKVIKQFIGPYSTLKTALLIGGDSMPLQLQQLRMRPRIIIGTPGRINDHLERGNLMLHDANYLVLDEMDRMLDMGFEEQIMKILKFLPVARQTLLFSATLPPQIIKISEKYLKNPERIQVGEINKAADKIVQEVRHLNPDDKYKVLVEELKAREGTVIIFVRAKHATEKLAERLRKSGFTADAIHGDLEQRQREKVLQAFRDQKHRILVATDVASRGLDIPHIEHVINYDLPMAPEDYIHRIGRTARAGAEGNALSFITSEDRIKWNAIQKLIDPNYKPEARAAETHPDRQPKPRTEGDSNRRSRGGRNRNRNESDRPQQATTPQQPRQPQQHAPAPVAQAAQQASAPVDSGANGGNVRQSSGPSQAPIPGLPPAI
jgi:superfamily II DNA/RNA helicase